MPVIAIALASVPAPAAQEGGQTIIVTGKLGDARRALDACLARKCPPLEDMAAALRYAEALFIAGDYKAARQVLRGATGRNGRHAAEHPREVAGLYRAASRIAAHLGEGAEYESRAYGMVRALKAGLDDDAPDVLLAQIEVAKTQASLGRTDAAVQVLEAVHRRAEATGQKAVMGVAAVRLAALRMVRGSRGDARRLLAPITGWTEPGLAQVRLAARLMLARIDRAEGKPDTTEALIADLRTQPGQPPMLLKTDPLKLSWYDPRSAHAGLGETPVVKSEHWHQPPVEKRWADIGFWVRPDGSVDEVEALRDSGNAAQWVDPVIAQIKSRIYAPTSDRNGPGMYRVERVTLTALWGKVTGTKLRVRQPELRIERLDLTAEPTES